MFFAVAGLHIQLSFFTACIQVLLATNPRMGVSPFLGSTGFDIFFSVFVAVRKTCFFRSRILVFHPGPCETWKRQNFVLVQEF